LKSLAVDVLDLDSLQNVIAEAMRPRMKDRPNPPLFVTQSLNPGERGRLLEWQRRRRTANGSPVGGAGTLTSAPISLFVTFDVLISTRSYFQSLNDLTNE
jgi:hypothetical protein